MGLKQLFDETGGFQAVELFDGLPEARHGQGIDRYLVQMVVLHDLEDQVALLLRAGPGFNLRCSRCMVAILVAAVAIAVGGSRQESHPLNVSIYALLEEHVEFCRLGRDLANVGDFLTNSDAELVGAEAGEPKLLAVVGFEGDGHRLFLS